jgi:outer membrane biosynthesis protein TonB
MTNSVTPAESIGAPSGAASFYRWEVAGKPIAILFSLELMDRLEREVLESFKAVTRRGSEIGGVLGGRVIGGSPPTVIIEQFEAVACDYSRGPLYLLSGEDKVRLKQALDRIAGGASSVTGFFRSNTRRELVLDEDDQALAKEFFSDPNHVFLLVRPFAMKPSAGGFFFWENGQLPETCYLQFPFKRAELEKNSAQFIVAAPEAPVVRELLVMPKRDELPPGPPVALRREEPNREEPAPAPPPPVFKREDPKGSPVEIPKREEQLLVVAKREEKPAVTPIAAKGEEPAAPKPEEKPIVSKPAEPMAVAPPKKEEPVKVEPGKAAPPEAERPKAQPVVAVIAAPSERASIGAQGTSQPVLSSRFKWAIILLLLLLVAGGGYYFFVRQRGPAAGSAKAADTLLGLKVDTNAGQLLLSWNRNAPLILTATRATLTINDGGHKEDVDLDLAALRNGSTVYSPISNDVSFRLEVADQKTGKSQAESVRRLAGRPSLAAPQVPQVQPQTAKAEAGGNEKPVTALVPQVPAPPQRPLRTPQVVASTAVTTQPAKENSLAARLRAPKPAEIPAAPALESQPNAFAGSAPNVPGAVSLAPPPPAPAAQRPPKAATPAPSVAAPPSVTRIGGNLQAARLLKQSPVAYPTAAKRWRVTGSVSVVAVVSQDGRVKKATAISGPVALRQAAEDSVMKWIYSPAILNGAPVEAAIQVDVSFHM